MSFHKFSFSNGCRAELVDSHFRLLFFVAIVTALLALFSNATVAQVCAVPGKEGPTTVSGVINTYYPAPSTASTSGTSIPVGAVSNISSALTPISAGDLLLVIQMQDALINSSDTNSYGAGTGTGNGFTSGNAGYYEYTVATNSVGTGGGTVITTQPLTRVYRNTPATTTRGRRTYQVIRIPQYSSATLSGTISSAAWNGTSGGIVAFDVAGNLNLGGATIDASRKGFRGGLGRTHNGTGGTQLGYRGLPNLGSGGSKGEGIAGTPRYIWDGFAGIDNLVEGYPNGSYNRGAPGNAGGGANDGTPSNNGENSGGGGGSNGGAGGRGGNTWNSFLTIGGVGGAAFPAAANRIVMGGGGGAGTTNNGAEETSSGAVGGGIVMIRSGTVSGSANIKADGSDAADSNPTCCGDGGGGGGAGGSIVLTATNPAGLSGVNASAKGGDGADPLMESSPHGPGAGGGGGVVVSNGFLGSSSVAPGTHGTTVTNATYTDPAYGAESGSTGSVDTTISQTSIPGTQSGAQCVPNLTVTKSTSTPDITLSSSGASATYTISIANAANKAPATMVDISDSLPQPIANGFSYSSTSNITLNNGASRSSTSDPTAGDTNPTWTQFVIPGGSSVVIEFVVSIATGVPLGTYQNPAVATYLDPTRTTTTGTSSAVYNSSASTAEDVTISGLPIISLLKACTGPVNCTTQDQPPGTDITYKIDFTNGGNGPAFDLSVVDEIPEHTDFKVGSATVNSGTTGLTFAIEYSDDYDPLNANAATWTYTPVSGGGGADAGYDRNVKALRTRVASGALSNSAPNNVGELVFTTKIR